MDPEALVATTFLEDEEDAEYAQESKASGDRPTDAAAAMARMECIYFKLWAALRWAVRVAFMSHDDVLDAGSTVQVSLTASLTLDPAVAEIISSLCTVAAAEYHDRGGGDRGVLSGPFLPAPASEGLGEPASAHGLHERPRTDRED